MYTYSPLPLPAQVSSGLDGKAVVEVQFGGATRRFRPEHVAALVLAKLKAIAEARLGVEVVHAVITVPSSFNSTQRQTTRVAGALAGLNVLRLVNESTAVRLIPHALDAGCPLKVCLLKVCHGVCVRVCVCV